MLEFGVVESARSYDRTTETKWIKDSEKLRAVLHRLHSIVSDELVDNVQPIGIITGGPCLQIIRCWARYRGGAAFCKALDTTYQGRCARDT